MVPAAGTAGRSGCALRRPERGHRGRGEGSRRARCGGRGESFGVPPVPEDGAHSRALSAPARRGEETSSRLTRVHAVGTILALANQKGGVGKTTTAVNVAACLAEAGAKTLVVDLDPQANATSGLGERANGTSSYDLLDGAPVAEIARPTRFANLELVPAKPALAGAAVELSDHPDGERYLQGSLAAARSRYGFV